MPTRNRNRTRTIGTGYARSLTGSLEDITRSYSISETCVDVVGNFPNPNPLTITSVPSYGWTSSGLIAGTWDTSNFPGGGSSGSFLPGIDVPSDNTAFSTGMARSNPNRPIIDVPLFTFELRDIPSMLREWGNSYKRNFMRRNPESSRRELLTMPRHTAQRYVEWQFAIAPMLSDLEKLLNFQGNVEKTLRRLEVLGQPGGGSFTGSVYDSQVSGSLSSWTYLTSLYREGRRMKYIQTTNRRFWTSTTYSPTIPLPVTREDKRDLAIKLAYGYEFSFSTVWNAMPWSWLIDWFSNAGDLVDMHRGMIPMRASRTCLMKHTYNSFNLEELSVPAGSTVTGVNFSAFRHTKQRVVLAGASPKLEFNLPILSGSQMAILSSLAVLKLGPK